MLVFPKSQLCLSQLFIYISFFFFLFIFITITNMSWESLLTPQETRLYSHLFQTVSKTQEGIVTGAEAVRFFATSGVPTEILSEVLCIKVYIYIL